MRVNHAVLTAAMAAGIAGGSARADVIVIDDFSSVGDPTPWPVIINTISTVNVNEVTLTQVIGATRYSTIRATYLEYQGLDFVQAAIVPNFGMVMDYSSTSGAIGDWNLRYDADGVGLNEDCRSLTDIVLGFSRFDYANNQPLPMTVTVSDGVNAATLTHSLTTPGAQDMYFALADFIGIGSVDLGHVQSIDVFLDPGLAVDFRLSSIMGVPTPGSLALLALGTVTLIGSRRRF